MSYIRRREKKGIADARGIRYTGLELSNTHIMTASRSGRRVASSLSEKQILAIAVLVGLVIAASIALASGKTVGQALGGYLIAQEMHMMSSPSGSYTSPSGSSYSYPSDSTTHSYPSGSMTSSYPSGSMTSSYPSGSMTSSYPSGGTPTTGTTGTPRDMCYADCYTRPPDMQQSCRETCDRMFPLAGGSSASAMSTGSTGSYPAAPSGPHYWSQAKQKSFPLTSASDCDGLVSRNEIPGSELDWCKMAISGSGQSGSWPSGGSQWGTGGSGGGSSMQRCFYPNASINGKHPGYTVWCQSDYNDCHVGEPSGKSISTAGLSLGAPSYCDSGWSTGGQSGSYGAPGGGAKWTCTGRNSAGQTNTIRCDSPNVGCDYQGNKLSNEDVNRTVGSNPACTQDSSGGDTRDAPWPVVGADKSPWGVCMDACRVNNPSATRYICDSKCASASGNTGDEIVECCAPMPECNANNNVPCPAVIPMCMRETRGQCKQKGWKISGEGRGGGDGGTGGNNSGWYTCEIPVNCQGKYCPTSVMPEHRQFPTSQPGMNCWPTGGGGGGWNDGGGWGGSTAPGWTGGQGGDQWNDVIGARNQYLYPLQNYKRQAGEMALRARENGVDVSAQGDAYIKAIDAAISCINGATTQETLNGCGNTSSIEQLSRSIWNVIQSAGSNRQFKEIEGRMQEMTRFAGQMKKGGADTQQLESILSDITGTISAVKAAMNSNSATPEMTRTDKIYALEGKFWQAAEMLRGGFQDQRYGNRDGGYADQCEMIRRKMEYVEDNYAAAAQLQDMYGKCIMQAQGAVTGKGFNEQHFTDIQDQFDAFGEQAYAERACPMVDRAMNEASNAINNEAPMMLQMLGGKNANAAAMLKGLLAKAKGILNRAYGHRQQNDCKNALIAMNDMEKMGQEAERIMSQAGIRFGGQDNMAFVDYSEQRGDISQRIAKEGGMNVKQLKKQLEEEGFDGAELAILDSIDPRLAARLFEKGAGRQGTDIVKAAANTDISTTKLEAIIEENAQLLQKVAALELQVNNLKAGVKTVVENIKNETFNPKIAPKIAALLEVASTLTEKEFRAKYEEYKTQSNKENVKAGIDPFEDVHTFDKGHEWFVVAVKDGVESGLFKGKGDGTFDPNGPVLRQDMAIVIAREQQVADGGDAPETPFAQKASAYATEALAGLEGLGVDFSEFNGAPTGAATRLEVARMVASVYSDMPSEADESVLEEYTDLDSLSEEDRYVVALVITNGIMTGTDGTFNPNGTFNRAQFATVMHRLNKATGTVIVEEDADTVEATPSSGTAGGGAAAGSEPTHAAASAAAESSSSAAPDPVYNFSSISWDELSSIRSLVSVYAAKHPLEIGLGDVTKALNNVDAVFLSDYKIYGKEVVAKKRVDINNQLLEQPLAKLKEILLKAGQPAY